MAEKHGKTRRHQLAAHQQRCLAPLWQHGTGGASLRALGVAIWHRVVAASRSGSASGVSKPLAAEGRTHGGAHHKYHNATGIKA